GPVDQTAWVTPGSVMGAVRTPPPCVSPASSTSTERPARARRIAAASPFGPEPTTTASYARLMRRSLPLGRSSPVLAQPAVSERHGDRKTERGRAVEEELVGFAALWRA